MNHCAKRELFWHHKLSPENSRGAWPRQPFGGRVGVLGSHHFPAGFDKGLALQPAGPRSGSNRQGPSSPTQSSQEHATDLKLVFVTVAMLTFLISVLNFDGQSGEREQCQFCSTWGNAISCLKSSVVFSNIQQNWQTGVSPLHISKIKNPK